MMRSSTALAQNGHASAAVAHVVHTRRCLHGRKRTARGRSMHTMHSFRSCASSRSRAASSRSRVTFASSAYAARLRHAVPSAHLDDLELASFRTVGARVSVLEDAALVARADRAVDARL